MPLRYDFGGHPTGLEKGKPKSWAVYDKNELTHTVPTKDLRFPSVAFLGAADRWKALWFKEVSTSSS